MGIANLGYSKLFTDISNYTNLKFSDFKYSYLIVKPNGNRHFRTYVEELQRKGFEIFGYYSVMDYATVNVALHPTPQEQRHIVPINNMFKDCYGNYGVIILIGKTHITYDDFVKEVYAFKTDTRKIFEVNYLSYVFDISKMLGEYLNQRLIIIDKDLNEVKKREMNHTGNFLVFSVNSLHSPDPNLEVTIKEMMLLKEMNLISESNSIPDEIVYKISEYESFVYLKDIGNV